MDWLIAPAKVGCGDAANAYRALVAAGWSVAELAALTPAEWFVVAALVDR
ncbi:MAG: hypothetical protein NVS3B12_27690 [Acidimicrobiales bacterium]